MTVPAPSPPFRATPVSAATVTGYTATVRFDAFGDIVTVPADRPALTGEPDRSQDWSYARLDAVAGRLADRLAALPPGLVAVLAPRTAGGVAGVVAATRAARTFLAVDALLPPARQAELIAAAGCVALIAPPAAAPPPVDLPVLPVLPSTGATGATGAFTTGIGPADVPAAPAYLVYTSGSTGAPKGVAVGLAALRHVGRQQRAILDLDGASRVAQLASAGFDAYVFELLMALGSGATLVLPGRAGTFSGPALAGHLHEHAVTHLVATPTALAALPAEGLPALRVVCSAGERCTTELRDRWSPGRRLLNLYGPAEAAIWATWSDLHPGDDPATIGRAIPGVRTLVLDGHRRPVPAGEPGELHLAGPTLADGYLGEPELTARRFPPLPGGAPGERMYATGDTVVAGRDGELRFIGRTDDQVKINGARVEPAEVEAALLAVAGVTGAAVVAVTPPGAPTTLAAVYTGDPAADPATALRERLPRWMVPTTLHRVGELPVNANGKLDRAAVRALATTADAPQTQAQAEPLTPLQTLVLDAVRELLDRPVVTLTDNFFDLGGHSILAFQLAVRIGAALGTDVELNPLFEAPDLRCWADQVERGLTATVAAARPPVRPVPAGAERPSVGQTELLAADQFAGGVAAYTSAWCERVTGPFDADRFAGAVRATAGRYAPLHSRFRLTAAGSAVTVDPRATIGDERVHLAGATLDTAVRVVEQAVARPYQLDREQPVRLHVVRLAPHEHLVTIMVHHVACDAVSFQVLLRETWARYTGAGMVTGDADDTFWDFAAWQAAFTAGPAGAAQRDWWQRRLAGLAPLRVRAGDAAGRPHLGRRLPFHLGADLAAAVGRTCRTERVSPFVVFSAAYAVALAPYTIGAGTVVGVPCTARGHAEFDETVGYFVNTLPLPIPVPAGGTAGEWLRALGGDCIRAFAHRDLPLPDITRGWTGEDGHPARLSVLFALNAAPPVPGGGRQRIRLDPGPVKTDLLLTIDRTATGWSGELVHDTTALDGDDAADLVELFHTALHQLTGDPGSDVRELVRRRAPATTTADFDFDELPA